MKAVEAGGYKESGAVYAVSNCKGGFVILEPLEKGEVEAQENGQS